MGRLIKNHLARLLVLWGATYQLLVSIQAIFWPKILFDYATKLLDPAVKPVPILQILNILFALTALSIEWPLACLAGSAPHRSISSRLFWLPLSALASVLLYQGTGPALCYAVSTGVYFWAYAEGEVVCVEPWTLPRRRADKG